MFPHIPVYHSKPVKIGPFRSSEQEIKDLLKAWIAISLAFAFARTGLAFNIGFIHIMLISAVTVGVGFLLHELGHKIVAQHYGCFAEFRASDQMLVIAVLLAAFTGFVFAAPGAVMIAGPIGIRRNGTISAAGPVVNYILALLFLPFAFFPGIIGTIGSMGMWINAFLGLFNMIPFGMFDGAKILAWNKWVYGILVVIGSAMVFGSAFL